MESTEFKRRLQAAGVEERVAEFVWDEFQPYYFSPLTPYPEDRPFSDMRIDGDDLSDIVTEFEKKFHRHWGGEWVGPEDPTLIEFALALSASTTDK